MAKISQIFFLSNVQNHLFCFRPNFDFTGQYIVKVDDFFLSYLQKVSMSVTTLYYLFNNEKLSFSRVRLKYNELQDNIVQIELHSTVQMLLI